MDFTEIWNEAYNIYTDAERTDSDRYDDMRRFLQQKVSEGAISAGDKARMTSDIIDTASL